MDKMVPNVDDCNRLLKKVEDISNLYEQEWRKSGNYFNIFSALGVNRKEIRHSSLLASILNPNGFHGMFDAFLKEFLNHIKFHKMPSENAIVKKEEYVGKNGRFDISICSVNKKYKVIIENKIDTIDHDEQLNKYFNELNRNEYEDYRVVYLTLNGDEPIEKISTENRKKLLCLSYKNDVIDIIDTVFSLKARMPVPVFEIMRQYVLTLKEITNQGVDQKMSEDIQNLLASNLENLKAALLIQNEINDAFFKKYLPEQIFKKIQVNRFRFCSEVSQNLGKESTDFGFFTDGKIKIRLGFGKDNFNDFSFWGYLKELSPEQINSLKSAIKVFGKWQNFCNDSDKKEKAIWAIYFDDYLCLKNKVKDIIEEPEVFASDVQNLLQRIVDILIYI